MRTGRPKQPLIVTNEKRQRLESLAHRTRSQARLARRARVMLGYAGRLMESMDAALGMEPQGRP